MKTCNICKISKILTEFHKNKLEKDGVSRRCKLCVHLHRKNNPSLYKKYKRKTHLKNTFNFTILQYNELLNKQEGKCGICKSYSPSSSRKMHFSIDHDHTTGQIRGLLCDTCNRGIGLLKDCPKILQNATDYLCQHSKNRLVLLKTSKG